MQGTSTQPAEAAAPRHHSAVRELPPVTTWRAADVDVDFIGTKTRRSYVAGMLTGSDSARVAEVVTPSYPPFDEEYFEWVDILESVEEATDTYVIIELGAGYGRWSMRAALTARRKASCAFQCVAVEAEPDHFRWMLEHFRDNGVAPEEHELIWAAVGPHTGFVPFWIGNADSWYGQAVASRAPDPLPSVRARRRLKARSALGRPPATSAADKSLLWVPCVTLNELLMPHRRVDLIDMDVQGAEVEVLIPATELLNDRVRRIHIGTHSAPIEQALRDLFNGMGWENLNDYPCQSRVTTTYGDITFGDGVQTWRNPVDPASRRSRIVAPADEQKTEAVETESIVTTLRARVAELEERNRTLKQEKVRLRERYRAASGKLKALRSRPSPLRVVYQWMRSQRRQQ